MMHEEDNFVGYETSMRMSSSNDHVACHFSFFFLADPDVVVVVVVVAAAAVAEATSLLCP
jgi:hypothetical protein